jgi:hypothetical protein
MLTTAAVPISRVSICPFALSMPETVDLLARAHDTDGKTLCLI